MPNELFISKLTAFKERLLDLTGRNRMIHSNFQAKTRLHFRFIDELPNQLYEKLSSSQMHFQALPDPDEIPKDENNSTFKRELEVAMLSDEEYLKEINEIEANESDDLNQLSEEALRKLKNRVREKLNLVQLEQERFSIQKHAEEHGFNPSFDLPKSKDSTESLSHHQDNKIQTLMLADNLKRHITSIWSQYKSSIRELGVNPLYVCFGFLEWTESAASEKKLYSPILMMQVEMDDEKPSSNLGISSTGESISINQTLNERLKRDFRIELPELKLDSEDDDEQRGFSVEDYLELVEEKIAAPNNWKIRNWASYGIYKAQNMPIYKDIEQLIDSNNSALLEKLISGSGVEGGDSESREIYEVDDEKYVTDVPALVTAADASQFSAIVDVIQGKNLVIKGPPGTGKSQTITNIIAALMLKGKKVLFVAQKQAALDVVRNNLAAVGLEKFLLEVFSIKGKKKAIMESFANRVNESELPDASNYYEKLTNLHETKKELNAHAQILSEEFEDSGISIHDIIWDVPVVENLPDAQLKVFELKDIKTINEESLNKNINNLTFVKNIYKKVFHSASPNDLVITRVKANISNPFERNKVIENLAKIYNETHELTSSIDKVLEEDTGFQNVTLESIVESEAISDYSNDKLNDDEQTMLNAVLDTKNADMVFKLLESELERQELQARLDEDKKFINENFDLKNSLYDAKDIKQAILKLKDSHIFSFFFSEWRAAHRLFREVYIGEGTFKGKEEAELLHRYQSFNANLESNTTEIQALELSIEAIEEDLTTDLPDGNIKKLKSLNIDYCLNLIEQLNKLPDELRLAWFKKADSLKALFKSAEELIGHSDAMHKVASDLAINDSKDVLDLASLLHAIQTSEVSLSDYMELLSAEESLSSDKGLKIFYAKFVELGIDVEHLDEAYKRIIRLMQQELVYQMHPDYAKYNSQYVEKLINDLEKYDKEINKLSSNLVASQSMSTLGRFAPAGNKSGKRSTWTDMHLINHVAATPAARTTVRELFQRAIDAATAIKPCTLMSPLAVSQTLKLDEIYDVVIIDEASQMKPEFSIGAIARGKQAVIVGDPNQLPPTSVFQTKNAEDPNDEDLGDESILDMGLAVLFPPRELLYHYRSRHEDLIRFSNSEFYKNLMIPVTARNEANKGIEHIFLEHARYVPGSEGSAGGINPKEADRVVEEVLRLMKERPHESIGVATMNQKQKELIENKFILEKSKSKDALKYEAYWAEKDAGLNEFFIKNLENVQGDERDVIVISTLYGPHQQDGTRGVMYQRFGDINKDAGWRRLNVLFTRAKNQILLVTSMTPADIQHEGKKRGVEVLKKYIGFAETKILQEAKSTDNEIESPFQHWAINQVNALPGFSAEWEIGASGYRIDIGVKHEDYPYGYVLAVETDGATYHSTKSARDRDLLRQKILEGYGWKFHRIWSSDWIANPMATKEKLHIAMKARLKECLEEVAARKAMAAEREIEVSDEVIFDEIPEDTNHVQAFAYPITDITDYLDVEPQKFSNQSYKSRLANAVNAVIELEGPIAFSLLVERIRKAHGFAKAGTEIRSTIASTIKIDTKKTTYNDVAFYWPANLDPEHYLEARFPADEARKIEHVAPEEIKSIEHHLREKDNQISDIAKAISEFLGHRVLKETSRTEIEDKLNY
tara:strand:+ start:2310 stop:7259 length:4950 start_codon:yes stop_codon:yes gene_type:complete